MTQATSRIILVTGAAGGIGRAMVSSLLAAGHRIAALDHDAKGLEALMAAHGGDARLFPIQADLASAAGCEAGMAAAVAHFGKVETVVNNAGIGVSSLRPDAETRLPSIEELNGAIWDLFFAIRLGDGAGGAGHYRQCADPGRPDGYGLYRRGIRLGARCHVAAQHHGAAFGLARLRCGAGFHWAAHHCRALGCKPARGRCRCGGQPGHRLARTGRRCGVAQRQKSLKTFRQIALHPKGGIGVHGTIRHFAAREGSDLAHRIHRLMFHRFWRHAANMGRGHNIGACCE